MSNQSKKLAWSGSVCILVALFGALSLVVSASTQERTKEKIENHPIVLDESSSGITDVSLGDEIEVCLMAALGAGYSWSLESVAGDAAKYVGTQVQSVNADKASGVGGQMNRQVFLFQATSIGTATLTFVYRRPWLKSSEPDRRLVFTIAVRANN
jgi:predicted secreted protein